MVRTRDLTLAALVVMASIVATGCGAAFSNSGRGGTGENTSSMKWGFLADSPYHLIKIADGATIGVCGPDVDLVGWAINTWAWAIGRRYDVVADCNNEHIDNWVHDTDYAREHCAAKNITTAYAVSTTFPQKLVDCGEMWGQVGYLHEVGHLFGLCDQYDPAQRNCVVDNGAVAGSIMNAADKTTLTEDDVDGIRALARSR